eukprot:CAMPEP_0113313666 /NCGR_PEP_ID=MMETSP0010_2-20120614/9996_1 /TAXON_ID=216773 ORGANISM="Corethron hystrix, Strain 308" /NCGR_SAMPLE_ID=MMETSP0010_2 /ASSEMBLY_ACC=CAM_ASM_000155 /LENGTH=226 /DNA_ID=CAMNT_0000169719 /DNA_START=93 /DNA_END=773 /DNA_ORIENTATION=- /assembly_acc=CAM_ASM_000155
MLFLGIIPLLYVFLSPSVHVSRRRDNSEWQRDSCSEARPMSMFLSPKILSDTIIQYSLEESHGRHKFIQRVLDDTVQYDALMSVCVRSLSYGQDRANLYLKGELEEICDEKQMEKTAEFSDSDINEIKSILNPDGSTPSSFRQIAERIEELFLPDPSEDPDGYIGLWEIIAALEGVEYTKYMRTNFENPNNDDQDSWSWYMRALACRVLVHYDFLTFGLGNEIQKG